MASAVLAEDSQELSKAKGEASQALALQVGQLVWWWTQVGHMAAAREVTEVGAVAEAEMAVS